MTSAFHPARRGLLRLLASGLAVAIIPAAAQTPDPPGSEYLSLPQPMPVRTPPPAIEVLDLFWYGCPHCYELEPKLVAWAAALPPDVRFRRLPAVLTESWRPAARLYFTLEALGRIETLHQAVFDAEHATHALQVQSRDAGTYADWAEKQGIARPRFLDAWNSAAVAERVDEAAQTTLPLRRIGVPALIVDGRYLSNGSLTGSHAAMLAATGRLIERVRAERAAAR